MKDRNKVAVSYLELGMLFFFVFFFPKVSLNSKTKKSIFSWSLSTSSKQAVRSLSGLGVTVRIPLWAPGEAPSLTCVHVNSWRLTERETICCQVQGRASWALSSHCPWSCWSLDALHHHCRALRHSVLLNLMTASVVDSQPLKLYWLFYDFYS